MRILSPLLCTVTMYKAPILGSNGIESVNEFHSIILHSHGQSPVWPKGNVELCTVNRMSNVWPFPNCVFGWVYYVVKYEKEDPSCDDSSTGR